MGALNLTMHIQSYKHGTVKNVSLGISFVFRAEEDGKIKTYLVIPHEEVSCPEEFFAVALMIRFN